MILTVLLLLTGLALIIFGADFLVDGASAIARKAGISEFVIGLTIVGFGTSMPELVVSLNGAINGASDIAAGNVVGSNIFNTLLILGLTAVILPIDISKSNLERDIPATLIATVLFICIGLRQTIFGIGEDVLTRPVGLLFIILFAVYMTSTFRHDDGNSSAGGAAQSEKHSLPAAIFLVVTGLAGLIFGGRLFVHSAQSIAEATGVSDRIIAITVLAGGTSFPELATCVVAAAKKRGQLALGNILGSNIFNILLILGCSSLVTPLSLEGMSMMDMTALLVSIAALALSAFTLNRNRLDRAEGVVFLLLFAAYYVWLLL